MTAQVIVFALCFVTCTLCAGLLVTTYMRTRTRIVLWCAVAFICLAVNNAAVLVDIYWPPAGNLLPLRFAASLSAAAALIYGFIWEAE